MQIAADLSSKEFRHDPYPIYSRLRETAPACRVRVGRGKFAWLVTRYADVLAALKDTRFTKDRLSLPAGKQPWVPAVLRPLAKNMLDSDPPDHTRLRALVQKAFTPTMIEALRNRVEELTEQLIDTALRKREFDLISEYALPLPATIIAELVGVPAEDRDRFHRWSAKVVSLSPSAGPEMLFSIPAALAFLKYIQQQIRIRRNAPGTDLLGALIAAEEGGDKLTEDELVAMIFLLLIAGHETTVNLIGNGTLALLENPEQLSKVLANPDLLRSAIEEMLRYYSPVQLATERWAREDVVMSETAIPKGDLVFLALASANRDSAQFREPHIFDIARNQGRHIAFGFGVHYCLGAPLARLEAEIAFKTLLRHLPEPVIAVSHNSLKWRKGFLLRGLERLPLFGRT